MKEQDHHGLHKLSTTTLVIAALGVVFGDIGTSPIYTLKECFSPHSPHHIAATPQHVLGVVSLVLWALIVLICVKYLVFVLRADNKGEGGVLSLMALVLAALPAVQGPASGIVAFIVAGLATSAVFPLTVALAGERLGLRSETAASVSTAALMTGVGVGSFVIGALREALGFDTLYRLGALYPLLALVLGRVGFARREPPSQR